ncbi:MAG: DUF2059 domain-containing protein [Bradyrhizobium sp.]|jgi:uncharacterized protein|uniref:DUF2059 domain-containing protein n=1 Tax=Bradyrhizobium sp. TaxID=376 RepID=UPI003C7AA127
MKTVFRILPATCFVLALALAGSASAQQTKPASAACMAGAREILAMKNVAVMYANAVPGIVQQAKTQLVQSNLNYQKDLDDVALVVAKEFTGKEKEIGEGMAEAYCKEFTDKEITDLVAFYKSPLGQKLLAAEPRAIQGSMAYMNQWAQNFADVVTAQFRAEMKKRGKPI